MPQSSTVTIKVQTSISKAADFASVTQGALTVGGGVAFSDGTGDYQADGVYQDERTLAASTSENLDLSGSLTNDLGQPVVLAKIRWLLIEADASNVNDVVVGNVTNGVSSIFGAATESIKIKSGGRFAIDAGKGAGYAVTAGTADLLKITNGGSGTPVKYRISIGGASA